jgi:metal-dependent amidase/aminoacylase/carboxypeptidase family protein
MTENMKRYAIEYLGEKNVVDLDLRMTAEDFAYYSHEIPACFYRIGTRNEKRNIISSLHTSTFDIDENALYTGMGLMAYLAYRQIEEMPF